MNLPASAACQLVPQATIFTLSKFAKLLLAQMSISSRNTLPVSCANAPQHGVAHGARLLENFLEHEMLVAALFRHDGVPRMWWTGRFMGGRRNRSAARPRGSAPPCRHRPGKTCRACAENRRNVGGHEVFAVAQPDHHRRAVSRSHNLLRIRGDEITPARNTPVISFTALRTASSRLPSLACFSTRCAITSVSVSVTNLWPSALQLVLQSEVVLDDAVVHHHDVALAIAVRMRVLFRGTSVRGPARVADAVGAVNGVQLRMASSRLRSLPDARRSCSYLSVHHGDARRVVPAVLQLRRPSIMTGRPFRTDIANDSAHAVGLLRLKKSE